MARKEAAQPQPPAPGPDKPVRLLLPPDVHARLRVIAAEHGKSMATYVRDLVTEHVDTSAKRRQNP